MGWRRRTFVAVLGRTASAVVLKARRERAEAMNEPLCQECSASIGHDDECPSRRRALETALATKPADAALRELLERAARVATDNSPPMSPGEVARAVLEGK